MQGKTKVQLARRWNRRRICKRPSPSSCKGCTGRYQAQGQPNRDLVEGEGEALTYFARKPKKHEHPPFKSFLS